MKNTQTKVGSFAAAKLQAKRRGLLAIIVIAAVIGFSFASCDDGGTKWYEGTWVWSITVGGIPNSTGTLTLTKTTFVMTIDSGNVDDYSGSFSINETDSTSGIMTLKVCGYKNRY
jgi:hypothetical protein